MQPQPVLVHPLHLLPSASTPRTLIAGSPQQERGGSWERLTHVPAVFGHERARPTAVLEPSFGVFASVAWGLDDTIQRHVLNYDYSSHGKPSLFDS